VSRQRCHTIGLSALVALVLASGAYAYLTSTGSGSAEGTVNVSLQPVSIAATTGNAQSLLPTGTATGDLRATITNPNSSRVHISQLVLDTSQGMGGFSANAANCALSFAPQSNGGSGWTIAAAGTLTIDLQSSLTMGTSAPNSCQNQTFTVYLKAG
jgi:hypothetical protein